MVGIRKGTSRAPSPTRVRWKWYDVIVGAAICRPPTPDHNRRKRAAGSRPYGERRWMGMEGIRKGTSRAPSPTRVRWKWYDKTRPLSVQLTRSGGRGTQGRALWGRGNMLRFLPTVDRPHLKRLPGSVLWLPFLPNKKVPPPAGCFLKYWERVIFQTDKPSTAVSNPSVKNRLRRADFCHLPLHKGGMRRCEPEGSGGGCGRAIRESPLRWGANTGDRGYIHAPWRNSW